MKKTNNSILIIMPELYYGGAETQFRLLIKGLSETGFTIRVLVLQSYNKNNRDDDLAFIEKMSKAVEFVKCDGIDQSNKLHFFKIAKMVGNQIKRNETNCIVLYDGLSMLATRLISRMRVPVIVCERNSGCYSKRTIPLRKFLCFEAASAIVCNSLTAQRNYSKYGYSIKCIYNGVSSEYRSDISNSVNDGTVLIPGRITPVKNQLFAIKALLKCDCTQVHKIILAGETDSEAYKNQIEEVISQYKGPIQIEILGFCKEMDLLYAQSNLILLPSISEGCPNVLLEGMAKGILCLASDIPQNRDVINDDRFLFDLADENDLGTKLKRLFRMSSEEIETVLNSNRKIIEKNYSTNRMVSSYDRLIKYVVNKG